MKKKIGVLGVLLAVLILGVGYAALTNRYLYVRGSAEMTADDDNFDVVFSGTPSGSGVNAVGTIDENDNHVAHINVSGLSGYGDTATVVYTVENISNGLGANLDPVDITIDGEYADYFNVTAVYGTNQLAAPNVDISGGTGYSTTLTVTVTAVKTPTIDVDADIELQIVARPVSD